MFGVNSDGCAVTRIEMLETVAVPSRFGQIGTSGAKARLARSSACPVRRTGELDFPASQLQGESACGSQYDV